MKVIKPYAEIIDIYGETDPLKKIEMVGRTCYKSTDKITDDSAPKFVTGLINRGHEAMLEHASFCFEVDYGVYRFMKDTIQQFEDEGFKSFIRFTSENRCLMSGNVRAWRDLFRFHVLHFPIPDCFKDFIEVYAVLFPEFQDPEIFGAYNIGDIYIVGMDGFETEQEVLTHCTVSVRFVVDRGVTHEIVRHRPASFAQESTRYCNYAKDKFGNELTFIIPEFFDFGSPEWTEWKKAMEDAEECYIGMIADGVTPEKARTILPHSLKTELIMTATCDEWIHFFNLRACNKTGKAHPQMLEVTQPLLDEFKNTFNGIFDHLNYGK